MQEQMIHPQTYTLLKGKQLLIYYKKQEVIKKTVILKSSFIGLKRKYLIIY